MTNKVEITQADRDLLEALERHAYSANDGGAFLSDDALTAIATHRIDAVRPLVEALLLARSWINQHAPECSSRNVPASEDGPWPKCDCSRSEKLKAIDTALQGVKPL